MARRPALPGVDRRQQILTAALDVFAEQGFEGATTKEIAEQADVTQGLIYFYFPSKEELFFAAFEHQAQQLYERLEAPIQKSGESPDVVIHRTIARLVEVLDAPRNLSLLRIMMRWSAHHQADLPDATRHHSKLHITMQASALREARAQRDKPLDAVRCHMREHMREQVVRMGAVLKAYLDEQVACGALRPVNTAVAMQLCLSGLLVSIMRRASGDDELAGVSREELVDTVASILLHGLLPQTVPVAPAPARV
jgi:AcrR family transcriptional regulator